MRVTWLKSTNCDDSVASIDHLAHPFALTKLEQKRAVEPSLDLISS